MPLSARLRPLLLLLGAATSLRAAGEPYDIVVYGDSAAAVAAAVQAKRQGSKVVLVNTTKFLGGMTCSGLSASDIFHREAVGGVADLDDGAVASLMGPLLRGVAGAAAGAASAGAAARAGTDRGADATDRWVRTHVVPTGGLDSWPTPDPAGEATRLAAGVELRVRSRRADWAEGIKKFPALQSRHGVSIV